jgi:hypothetical protein
VKNILTPSDDEDRVHAGVILEGAGEQAVQVVALTPAYQYCSQGVVVTTAKEDGSCTPPPDS